MDGFCICEMDVEDAMLGLVSLFVVNFFEDKLLDGTKVGIKKLIYVFNHSTPSIL
jgi:hypothetical protein